MIQMVNKWEEVVNSLKTNYPIETDIYITGSNAYLLSSELSTLLSGRFIEINMLPLSFKEYLLFEKEYRTSNNKTIEYKFEDYLKYGSLPVLFDYKESESYFNTVLEGIYNTVLIKDVIQRNNIKNTVLLENISIFTFDNIGNMISPKNISKYIKNDGINTTPHTVQEYLKSLCNAYLFYMVNRYDVKAKSYLKTLCKCYAVDLGIRNALLGFRNVDRGHILENIVFLELKRRGYKIAVGKNRNYEIDFIATDMNTKKYYQVTESIKDRNVLDREIRPLESIKDNYEKIILSMDKTFIKDKNGIKFQNILDFLVS